MDNVLIIETERSKIAECCRNMIFLLYFLLAVKKLGDDKATQADLCQLYDFSLNKYLRIQLMFLLYELLPTNSKASENTGQTKE